ncbi:MAG: hypothetical protein JF609_11140 [Verrucomicrobia bacterium]|nr:hypothetical protein [Verrucomicrobiota bacterium]
MVFGAVIVVGLLYIFVYWPISPLGSQLHNLKLAEQHANVLREKFKNDPRFQNVKFGRYTGGGGCFEVYGKVETEDDIRYVTNIVESVPCPVEIYYSLSASNGFISFYWMDRRQEGPRWLKP